MSCSRGKGVPRRSRHAAEALCFTQIAAVFPDLSRFFSDETHLRLSNLNITRAQEDAEKRLTVEEWFAKHRVKLAVYRARMD